MKKKVIMLLIILNGIFGLSFIYSANILAQEEKKDELINFDKIQLYSDEILKKLFYSNVFLTDYQLEKLIIELKRCEKSKIMLDSFFIFSGNKEKKNKEKLRKFNTNVSGNCVYNHSYFINANLEKEYNKNGTCGYVASTLLLGYYNYILKNDKRIIRPAYLSRNSNYMVPKKEYHDFLYEYVGKNELKKSHWLTQQGMSHVMNWVLRNDTDYEIKELKASYTTIIGSIKNKIDDDTPVVACFLGFEYIYENSETFHSYGLFFGHDVVIYGYQESDLGTYFICHMGWKGSNNTKVFIKPSSISLRHGFAYLSGSAL